MTDQCQPISGYVWFGRLSVDLRKGALSVSADGLPLIDEKHVCWGIVFPDKNGFYDHASALVEAVNSYAALLSRAEQDAKRIEELEKALQEARGAIDMYGLDDFESTTEAVLKEIDAALQRDGA